MIKIDKTIYDPPAASDGQRVLVMTLWPRGISKEKVDRWMKELGTDKDLIRRWKAGEIEWGELKKEYQKGLKGKENLLKELAQAARKRTITLLCSCKDEKRCHRFLLKQAVEKFLS